ncbi:MAG: class I SAM-dependent methyltransferase [Streptosporangiales bacterium]|nr:class I SAM-dependent methyltransferase [Streptosporangiales bacterium]
MTTPTLDHLTPVQKTLLITLKERALDSRARNPILGDPLADDVMRRIDYDFDTVKLTAGVPLGIALRSKMLDRAVRDFLAAHPNAVVVELGCGLETRMFRVDPPAGVDWYDVDFEEVIGLRRRVLPERAGAHPIGASLTDPDWLDGVPADRPTIIVADGVLGFLSEDDNRQILTRLTDHFAGGELVFNAYTRLVARLMGSNAVVRSVGVPKGYRGFGFDDPRELEKLNPRLTFIEEQVGYRAPEVAQLSWPMRAISGIFARWPSQARRGVWVVRYRF